MVEESGSTEETNPVESILHWKTLRERLEPKIEHLEGELRGFRWERVGAVGIDDTAERRYERLLRLRRIRAKVVSRERHAAAELTAPERRDREKRRG